MINKQQLTKSALTSAFLFILLSAGAKAQVTEIKKTDQSRTAKVKIMEKEGDHYLVLDTTLTLAEGMSIRDAVKNLREGGVSLKSLGAKVMEPTTISETNIFLTLPGQFSDSLRVKRFRRGDAQTIISENFSITMVDSAFKSIRPSRVLIRGMADGEGLDVEKAQSVTYIKGRPIISRALTLDSTFRGRVIYVRDSSSHNLAETRAIEKIRVLKGDLANELKIISLGEGNSPAVLELGDYNVTKISSGKNHQVIILRASKEKKAEGKKAVKKKPAEVNKLEVQVYPNPTSGTVKLSFNVPNRADTKVRIVDSQGKAVFEDTRNQFQGEYSRDINLSKYGAGVYVIQFLSGKIIQSEKVLVQ